MKDESAQLLDDGYCVLPRIVPPELIERLRARARAIMAADPDAYAISTPMPLSYTMPEVRDAICLPALHEALAALGIGDLRYYSAVLLNNRPGEGPGGWHHDWWAWQTPEAMRH